MDRKQIKDKWTFCLSVIILVSCGEAGKQSPAEKTATKPVPVAKQEFADDDTFDMLRFMVNEEAKSDKKARIDAKNYFVSFENEGDSYKVGFSKIAEQDLNKDGVTDYIILRNSEGMLGGSANTNSEIEYLIMSPGNAIAQRHKILAYAPFSYNILDDIRYKNRKLKAKATQNYRTYLPEDNEELASTDLTFIYQDGNVFETSYLKECALAKWKHKQLFHGKSSVTRTIEQHNYTEEIHETYNTGDFDFSAEFSGCDNLNLLVEGTYSPGGTNSKILEQKKAQFLEYLVSNTALSKEFRQIKDYLSTHEIGDEEVELEHFSFNFYVQQEKGKTRFRIVLNEIKNPNQTENWEITIRQ